MGGVKYTTDIARRFDHGGKAIHQPQATSASCAGVISVFLSEGARVIIPVAWDEQDLATRLQRPVKALVAKVLEIIGGKEKMFGGRCTKAYAKSDPAYGGKRNK